MASIEINGQSYEAQPGQMLIEITDAAGIEIPRFCYHKKLSVSANCRMCLVEVEKAPKPMPACATPVMDGMKVYTRSPKALAAQKAVMEFLLINHPLDCPICDQGGECELQDLAIGYGQDASCYQEGKRVVPDKDIGPLIATEMTRCIHCTRCVRFGEEIAGIREMGATGRGEHTRIGTYIAKTVDSELSGNVIDLCPVGALTSKPFRFHARAWEMQQFDSIAPHDAVGSNLHVHVRRGEVMRVAPKENEEVNEVWISDRDRFSYAGLYAEDRLQQPMIKQNGTWRETDWETALVFAAEGLKKAIGAHGAEALGALASPTATLEEFYLLQKLARGLGSQNLDHRLYQSDFSDQEHAPKFPSIGQSIADLEQVDAALVIGSHLRKEQPLLNHRLRKAALNNQAKVMWINPLAYEYNFSAAAEVIAEPSAMPTALAAVAKALMEEGADANKLSAAMQELLKTSTTEVEETHRNIAKTLHAAEKPTLLLGRLATASADLSVLRALAGAIAQLSGAALGYVDGAANSAGAWLTGMLPHRGPGGQALDKPGVHAGEMFGKGLNAYLLLGLEPELDSCHGEAALTALNQAEFVVSLSAYHTPVMESYADVLLPIAQFVENAGTYINCEGRAQTFSAVVKPRGEARPAWKILRVLGNVCDVDGFEYAELEEVSNAAMDACGPLEADTQGAWRAPEALSTVAKGTQRVTELPIYSSDALVRRAPALQQTADMLRVGGIHVNPALLKRLGKNEGDRISVRHNGGTVEMEIKGDPRVPENCALIYAGQAAHIPLGGWHGTIEL